MARDGAEMAVLERDASREEGGRGGGVSFGWSDGWRWPRELTGRRAWGDKEHGVRRGERCSESDAARCVRSVRRPYRACGVLSVCPTQVRVCVRAVRWRGGVPE